MHQTVLRVRTERPVVYGVVAGHCERPVSLKIAVTPALPDNPHGPAVSFDPLVTVPLAQGTFQRAERLHFLRSDSKVQGSCLGGLLCLQGPPVRTAHLGLVHKRQGGLRTIKPAADEPEAHCTPIAACMHCSSGLPNAPARIADKLLLLQGRADDHESYRSSRRWHPVAISCMYWFCARLERSMAACSAHVCLCLCTKLRCLCASGLRS